METTQNRFWNRNGARGRGILAALSFTALSFTAPSIAPWFPSAALAHEKAFPARQLKALTPEGEEVTYKESPIKPAADALAEFEKKYGLAYSKGELLGNLFLGAGAEKKVKFVALFLDGKSDRGDTEFGAAVNPQGRLVKVAVYSSPESADATAEAFLSTLAGKDAAELDALRKGIPEKETSKKFIAELALKAVGRVQASFTKK